MTDENTKERKFQRLLPATVISAAVILIFLFNFFFYADVAIKRRPGAKKILSGKPTASVAVPPAADFSAFSEGEISPVEGVILPARWSDLGAKMISVGMIDAEKLESLYASRAGLSEKEKKLLYDSDNANLEITSENSGLLLNLLWALGLGNKNPVLENGPMAGLKYGGAGNFASTGGWTLAKGSAMDHYSRHPFVVLTQEQQKLIERVSKNIYRPCCDNPAHFPDCNHGMAMLGLLELLASQGANEEEMYRSALIANAYWFPDQYAIIARYLGSRGITLAKADPEEILGSGYSSVSGFRRVASLTPQAQNSSGGSGCGLSNPVPQDSNSRSKGGCGL